MDKCCKCGKDDRYVDVLDLVPEDIGDGDVLLGIDENGELAAFNSSAGGGTDDHSELINRDLPDQHPFGAITGLSDTISGINESIQTEAQDRQEADSVLDTAIQNETIARQSEDSALDSKIDSEIGRAIAASQANTAKIDTINTKLDSRAPVVDTNYTADATTVTETLTKENIGTGTQSQSAKNFPIATETTAGAISAQGYSQIIENEQRIASLEQSFAEGVRRLTVQNTKADLDAYVLPTDADQGDTAIVRVDETQSGYTTEYELDSSLQWQYLFTINTTTPIATQTILGTVKGNTGNGTVFVEADGTMSVNGWDELHDEIPTNLSQLNNDAGFITNDDVNIQDATSTIKGIATLGSTGGAARYGQKGDIGLSNVDNTSDANKPVSTAQQNALDNKVDETTSPNLIYATAANGAQTQMPYSQSASGLYIPQRDQVGNIAVPASVTGNNAIGAEQVAGQLAQKQAILTEANAGQGINIDSTNPAMPIISVSGGGSSDTLSKKAFIDAMRGIVGRNSHRYLQTSLTSTPIYYAIFKDGIPIAITGGFSASGTTVTINGINFPLEDLCGLFQNMASLAVYTNVLSGATYENLSVTLNIPSGNNGWSAGFLCNSSLNYLRIIGTGVFSAGSGNATFVSNCPNLSTIVVETAEVFNSIPAARGFVNVKNTPDCILYARTMADGNAIKAKFPSLSNWTVKALGDTTYM